MKKRYLIIIIILMLGVTGCKEKKEYESSYHEPRNMSEIVELVSEENLNDIITTEYSSKELEELKLKKGLTLEELDSKYRIEYIKIDISEPNSYYKVVYKSKKNIYLFILMRKVIICILIQLEYQGKKGILTLLN